MQSRPENHPASWGDESFPLGAKGSDRSQCLASLQSFVREPLAPVWAGEFDYDFDQDGTRESLDVDSRVVDLHNEAEMHEYRSILETCVQAFGGGFASPINSEVLDKITFLGACDDDGRLLDSHSIISIESGTENFNAIELEDLPVYEGESCQPTTTEEHGYAPEDTTL